MADTCPKGGNRSWRLTENGNSYVCTRCGQLRPASTAPTADFHKGVEESNNPNESKIRIPFSAATLIALIIELLVLAALIIWTPLEKVIELVTQQILNQWAPNLVGALTLIFWYFVLGIIAIVILVKGWHRDLGGIVKSLQLTFLIVDILMVIGLATWYTLQNFGVFDSYLCLDANLITLSKISPDLAQRCVNYQKSLLPQCDKQGVSEPLDIAFEFNSPPYPVVQPSNIIRGQVYDLPVTLKNLDTQNYIGGVVVKGYVNNGTCFPGSDCVNMKSITLCSEDNPCTIPAGQTFPISLRSDAPIMDKVGTFEVFDIQVSYPGMAYGSANFRVLRSIRDLSTVKAANPQCSSGPMDVVIYWLGNYYLASSAQQNEVMYVALANNGKGLGKVDNITLNRVGDFALDKAQCQIPWKKDETFSEGSTYDLQGVNVPKTGNIQFSCTINIDSNTASQLLDNLQDSSKTIPFTANAYYNYIETRTYEATVPVQKS